MKKEENKNIGANDNLANEPAGAYQNMKIKIFSSFEEENEYTHKLYAETSYDKRMTDIEYLRKSLFDKNILPNNTWKPISRVFKIMPPYTNEIIK